MDLWLAVLVPALQLRLQTRQLAETRLLKRFLSLQKHRIRVNKLLRQALLVQLLLLGKLAQQRMQQLKDQRKQPQLRKIKTMDQQLDKTRQQ